MANLNSTRSQRSQFVIFKTLSYCFEEAIAFDVEPSLARRPVAHLIKPGDVKKEFQEKAIQFHGIFHGLKITNCSIFPLLAPSFRVNFWPDPSSVVTLMFRNYILS